MKKLSIFLLFVIFIVPFSAFAQTDEPTATAIELGDTVEGELSLENGVAFYTFELDAATAIEITLIAPDFDAYLALLDEDGAEIAADDDGAGSLNSQISMTLSSGTYTIAAQSYGYYRSARATSGDFTLSLEEFQINQIEYTQTVESTLTASKTEERYIFNGQAGDLIIIAQESSDFDSYLILEFNGAEITRNDDGGEGLNSKIGPYVLPSTGQYTIISTSYTRSSTGDYTLSLTPIEITEIEKDETLEFSFTRNSQSVYLSFEADQGDVLDILVDSEFQVNILVKDSNEYTVSDETNTNSLNAVIINTDGTYTLEITPASSSTVGDISVQITEAVLPSLSESPQIFALGYDNYQQLVTLDVKAGIAYRLTVAMVDGESASPSLYIAQNGIASISQSASGVSRISADFTATSSGTLVITISEYSYESREIEVIAEELGTE